MFKKIYFIMGALFSLSTSLYASSEFKPVTEAMRDQAAAQHIAAQPNRIAIYAKGFVCSSCGIGLRIHLKKLPEVDSSQFDKGVLMDASKQLLVLGIKADSKIDSKRLAKAIVKAGYDSEYYYQWNGHTTQRLYFQQEESDQ
tara:strand:+ start:609 stop:1034 length:426 start_codon:yes stop_codon:yes gene_type:complete